MDLSGPGIDVKLKERKKERKERKFLPIPFSIRWLENLVEFSYKWKGWG
jgi:hypothetical protein